jgi:hypothetical protein
LEFGKGQAWRAERRKTFYYQWLWNPWAAAQGGWAGNLAKAQKVGKGK